MPNCSSNILPTGDLLSRFSQYARKILSNPDDLPLDSRHLQDHHLQLLGTALTSGALPALEKLYLYNNQIGDVGISALADAVSKQW